jgi:ubiquinone/menaquinone biosynthesis C-methylase UbiE
MAEYQNIRVAGGDTATPINIARRFDWLARHLDLRSRRILDCGCGAGEYVLRFLEFTPHVQGIEYNADKVRQHKERGQHPELVQQGDIEHLPYADGSFDVVFLNEVLEHVPDDLAGLREIHRVLAPGGRLAIFSPNRLYPFETHGVACLRTGRGLPHYTPGIPYIPLALGNRWFRYYARNYFPGELAELLQRAGFTVRQRGWIGQTFEGISHNQPGVLRRLSPALRRLSFLCERIPLLNRFTAVSQFVVAEKQA